MHLERELDITLVIYLHHLRKVHSKFFNDISNKPEQLLDTKFYIRKLKNEVFTVTQMISFEQIINRDIRLSDTFEGHMCDKFNLFVTNDFRRELENNDEMEGLILTHDKLSAEEEERIRSKFPNT